MHVSQPAARNDTMLGVCQSLGEDFGINPNILRVAFGVGLIWQPLAMIGGYLGLAVVIAVSHWLFPHPRAGEVVEINPAQHPEAAYSEAERLPQAA